MDDVVEQLRQVRKHFDLQHRQQLSPLHSIKTSGIIFTPTERELKSELVSD